jgi:hypothetical protein
MRTIAATAMAATTMRIAIPGERRPAFAGGVILGSVVAVPHLKQIRALAAISVPQFLQTIGLSA